MSDKNPSDYLGDRINNTLFLEPINKYEIEAIVKAFKKKNSAGIDNINQRIVIESIDCISEQLAAIFNNSILAGIFPLI